MLRPVSLKVTEVGGTMDTTHGEPYGCVSIGGAQELL